MKQFHNINRPSGIPLSTGERPGQGDMSRDGYQKVATEMAERTVGGCSKGMVHIMSQNPCRPLKMNCTNLNIYTLSLLTLAHSTNCCKGDGSPCSSSNQQEMITSDQFQLLELLSLNIEMFVTIMRKMFQIQINCAVMPTTHQINHLVPA